MLIVTRLSLWHWSLCWQGPADRVNLGMKRAGPCQFPGWKPEQVALHFHQCIAIGLDFASRGCRSVGSALPERWFSPCGVLVTQSINHALLQNLSDQTRWHQIPIDFRELPDGSNQVRSEIW